MLRRFLIQQLTVVIGLGFLSLSAWSAGARADQQSFSANLLMGYSRGFDEYSHGYQSGELELNYALSKEISASAESAYDYRLSEYEDRTDKSFQIEDTLISMGHSNIGDHSSRDNYSVSAAAGVMLPTSETSQKASLRGAAVGELILAMKVPRYLVGLALVNRLYLKSHEFETADVEGTTYNTQYDLMNGVVTTFNTKGIWTVAISGYAVTSRKYSGKSIVTQIYGAKLNYKLTEAMGVYLKGRTKDRVVANNSLLDDDNSKYSVGMTYSF